LPRPDRHQLAVILSKSAERASRRTCGCFCFHPWSCIRAWLQPSRKPFHNHFEKQSTRRSRDKTSRAATNLIRAEFARRFALDPRALQDWEQGRRRPDRAARAYLTVISRHPEAVVEALAS